MTDEKKCPDNPTLIEDIYSLPDRINKIRLTLRNQERAHAEIARLIKSAENRIHESVINETTSMLDTKGKPTKKFANAESRDVEFYKRRSADPSIQQYEKNLEEQHKAIQSSRDDLEFLLLRFKAIQTIMNFKAAEME